MSDYTMVKTIFLRAPRERVWAYLTEADLLARWFHEGKGVMQAGEGYELYRENPVTDDPRMLWGDVLEAVPHERLVYTFTYHNQDADMKSIVTWTLDELPGGTKLTLEHTHEDASDEAMWGEACGTDKGWDEHLARLRNIFH